MRPLFRGITWPESLGLALRRLRDRLRTWWRDSLRGYTDDDIASARAKLWDQRHLPHALVEVTDGELRAIIAAENRLRPPSSYQIPQPEPTPKSPPLIPGTPEYEREWNKGAQQADDSSCGICGKRGGHGGRECGE